MPEEGPSRAARQQARTAAAAAAAAARTRKASAGAMRAALGGEASWGMAGEDARGDEDDDSDVDWRRLWDAGRLTQRQAKVAERIRAKEYKIKVG